MSQNTLPPQDPRQAQPAYYADDEISLIDLFNILREQWKVIAALALAAPVVALAVTLAMPSLYQADVLVQIGRIGNAGAGAGAGAADIEPPSTLAQRLNSQGFDGRIADKVDPSFSLKAVEIKNTKLLRIEGRATSPNSAKTGVEQTLQLIEQDHKEAIEAARKNLSEALLATSAELKSVTQALERLNQAVISFAGDRSGDAISSLLLTQTQSQLTSQRIALLDKVATIETLLLPQNLSATRAVEPIQVSSAPVYPKTNLVLLIAFLAGGFAGVLLAFLRNALKKSGTAYSQ